jgi:hypothetical protein
MNKLIEKLAKEANAWYPKGYPSSEGGDEAWQNLVIFEREDLEKFSELIVEECGRVADVFCHIWCEEDKPHDVTVGNYIKRHVLRADPE